MRNLYSSPTVSDVLDHISPSLGKASGNFRKFGRGSKVSLYIIPQADWDDDTGKRDGKGRILSPYPERNSFLEPSRSMQDKF